MYLQHFPSSARSKAPPHPPSEMLWDQVGGWDDCNVKAKPIIKQPRQESWASPNSAFPVWHLRGEQTCCHNVVLRPQISFHSDKLLCHSPVIAHVIKRGITSTVPSEAFDYSLWPTSGPTNAPLFTGYGGVEDNQVVSAHLRNKTWSGFTEKCLFAAFHSVG